METSFKAKTLHAIERLKLVGVAITNVLKSGDSFSSMLDSDFMTAKAIQEYLIAQGIGSFIAQRFKIGDGGTNTPPEGSNSYTNSSMIGIANYDIFRNGTAIYPIDDYTNNPTTGGFTLNGADIFGLGETFIIK